MDLYKEANKKSDTELIGSDPILEIEEFATPLVVDKSPEKSEEEINSDSPQKLVSCSNLTDIREKIESADDWQKFNETTPKRPPNVINIERKRKRQVVVDSVSTPTEPSSRKSLKFGSTPSKTLRYNLGSIYERLFGSPPNIAHHAEADVISLQQIMLKYGRSFVDYAEKNAKPFSEVKKLGVR